MRCCHVVVVRNSSVSLSPTLARNEKVEHYIKIKTHKLIVLRFLVESGVNALCDWAQVSGECQCLMWLNSCLIGVCSLQ